MKRKKTSFKRVDMKFVGYSTTPEREFYQIRSPAPEYENAWPNEAWKTMCLHLYCTLEKVCKELYFAIQKGLNLPYESFYKLLDDSFPQLKWGSSVLRIYQYNFQQEQKHSGCNSHCDLGLITVLPFSTFPSLRAIDFESGRWIKVEEELFQEYGSETEKMFLVMCGEQLAKLTNGFFSPLLHNVKLPTIRPENPRYSAPFFLRACPESLISTLSDDSLEKRDPNLPHFESPTSTENMTVQDYMDQYIFLNREWKPRGQTDW